MSAAPAPLNEQHGKSAMQSRQSVGSTPDEIEIAFKGAMRRLATTIALVTSGQGEAWCGMAATSVASLCVEPPMLLVAVNKTASMHMTLSFEKRFCVNLLSKRHQELVKIFSGKIKGRARFDTGDWAPGWGGLPILKDSLSSIVCKTDMTYEVGTHTLFIGEVVHVSNNDFIDPLLWLDGGFASAMAE